MTELSWLALYLAGGVLVAELYNHGARLTKIAPASVAVYLFIVIAWAPVLLLGLFSKDSSK